MERLNFDQGSQYDGLEAAIHIARYSFARPYCTNKRVLDIACGEGYGSHLMARWGAAEVVGADVSPEALQSANAHFSSERISFVQSEGETLLDKFEPQSFDLIVSFETIEHVSDPVKFLSNLKTLVKPGGFIAISCPNDWWYFPTDEEKNPFHLRKYHFDDFKLETEGVLGEARGWFLGGPATGFLNVGYERYPAGQEGEGQLQMLNTVPLTASFMVPADRDAGPQPANASYFLGLWGDGELAEGGISAGAAILPLSMDSFRTGIFQGHMPAVKEALEAQEAKHRVETSGLEAKARAGELRVQALGLELQLTREQLGDRIHRSEQALSGLQQRNSELELAAARYVRISSAIPAWLRKMIIFFYRQLGKSGRGN